MEKGEEMAKLIDFKCRYAEYTGISKELAAAEGLSLPEAYMDSDSLVRLAMAMNGKDGYCVLPMDPTTEAENLGAAIKYDDSPLGPRKAEDVITKVEQLAELPPMDVTKGRIAQTLAAVRKINQEGGKATIEIDGPIAIINGLADIMRMLMGWRKNPEAMNIFFANLVNGLTDYAIAAREAGCEIIYYTDSPGSLNIVGPKYAKQIVESFTVPFLRALDEKLDKDCIVHLCPKTSFMLVGCEKAGWQRIELDKPMPYIDACMAVKGKAKFLGQRCRKDDKIEVSHIHSLKLND